jgi:DNA replication and repair protein RecF
MPQSLLHLEQLDLTHFRNYESRSFRFKERIVGFCGPNGAGKTNLLDAVYYLCLTKSYFGKSDQGNVCFGKNGFRIQGRFSRNQQPFNMVCILRETGKKELQLNDETYTRFSQHIGKFPVVVVAPDDVSLVSGGSEERRKLLDTILSQVNAEYLQQLIQYTRLLQQRNSLLKQFNESGRQDPALLDVLDDQLVKPGQFIHQQRQQFLESYISEVVRTYTMIAGDAEGLNLQYQSQLSVSSFGDLLARNRERDIQSQRTSAGPHRDELEIRLGDQPLRYVASQGQRKSLLFALKLAEFEVLRNDKGFEPILLLDDVFEKLDEGRMHNLLLWACVENKGQVFLTDTHCSRLRSALEKLNMDFQVEELGV